MKRSLLLTAMLLTASFFIASCNTNTKPDQSQQTTKQKSESVVVKKQIPHGAYPIIYHSHLYIKSKIDSAEGYFVFDSGADKLYIDSTFYADNSFHHYNIATARLPGVGNEIKTLPLILDEFQIGFLGRSVSTIQTPIIQLKPILGDIADGIIGNRLLSDDIMQINYLDEYIIIYDNIESVDLSEYSKIACERIKNRFYIPVEVKLNGNQLINDKFLLDLGSGGSISLTSSVAKSFGLAEIISEKSLYTTTHGGLGGESSSYDFMARSVKLGDFQFEQVSIDYSNDIAGALSSDKYAGLVGNKILERFDVVLDIKNAALYLKPNKNFANAFEFNRLGFKYTDRSRTLGYWVVRGTWEGSSAEKAGIKTGQHITHLNGIAVQQISYEDQKAIFDKADKVALTIKGIEGVLEVEVPLKSIL